MARAGLELHRAVLADWVGKAAFHLKPVVDRLAEHLKRSGKLFMDETTAPALDPGHGTTKTGYLWALARDDRPWGGEDPPGVVYFYAPGRAGENAEAFLTGFDGILQVDGYTGYNRLTKHSRKGGAPFGWPNAGRMIAPWVIKGAMNGTALAAYVEKVLVPELAPGKVISRGNAPPGPFLILLIP
ncbi:Transposase IS66 family protein [Paracoccus halophilus]|uniref:Transposase IS66 family protein n=1 Tax=Paracoccus halophilus TaxID=376733 RepID=A0A1I0UFL2_9RHOB|nr:Transposase IS66 family protein [Paracoccus halophilus]